MEISNNLANKCSLANIGFDTVVNEPSKVVTRALHIAITPHGLLIQNPEYEIMPLIHVLFFALMKDASIECSIQIRFDSL